MKKKFETIGPLFLIATILILMLLPAFRTTAHSFRVAHNMETMRNSIEHELEVRNRENRIRYLAFALAGSGITLLIVGRFVQKRTQPTDTADSQARG